MTNKALARALKETAALVELTGGNPHRARALHGAARTLDDLDEPATRLLEAGTLTDLPGIGAGTAGHIGDLVRRGSFDLRDGLLEEVPPGLLDVLRVRGLGTKKARRLWTELGIASLDDLEAAAAAGRLAALDGFGAKTQANLLENARLEKRYRQRRRFAEALTAAEPVLEALRRTEGVLRAELTGALRRTLETVAAAEIVAVAERPRAVQNAIADHLTDEAPRPEGDDLVLEGHLPDGLPLRIRLVPEKRFGTAQWLMTGAEAHCAAFQEKHGAPEAHADEEALYAAAGLPFIAPELREGRGELQAAATGALPDLIRLEDLRGALHNHSTYSDGAHTLREMAEAARAMGLEYFGICDHSQSLAIADGLSPVAVARQQDEIRALNKEFAEGGGAPFRIFSGTESDILKDGALDYSDDVLASFDFVVASVHTGMSMTEKEATARIVTAVENPHTTILGHATGRLLLSREGYPLDHRRVIKACAEHGVAIELNANPYRLDLDWRFVREAIEAGVLISINADAHSVEALGHLRWGVAAARKGWLTAAQCLNAKPLEAFADWLDARRSSA